MKETNINQQKDWIIRFIDSALSKSFWRQMVAFVIFISGLLLFLCGLYCVCFREIVIFDPLLHFINPASFFSSDQHPNDARKIAALFIGLAGMFCLSGLLIPIVNNVIARRRESVQNGQVSYFFNDHYLIVGFDEGMMASIIKQMHKENSEREIVVQTTKNVKNARRQLEIDLDKSEIQQVIFMYGASTSNEDLRKLYVNNAHRIVILGDGTESHDVLNIQCLWQISELLEKREGKKLECDVLLNNQSTFTLLQKIGTANSPQLREKVHIRPFNFYETWAQKLIVDNDATVNTGEQKLYTALDREGIQYNSDKSVHFIIMGMNSMGIALAMETARTAHFPNFIRDNRLKTHITFIDPNAEQRMNFLISHYPYLFELLDFDYTDTTQESPECKPIDKYKNPNLEFTGFLDLHFSFVKGNFESPQVRSLLSRWAQNEATIPTIAICDDNTSVSTAAGLYLPPIIFSKKVPVYLQQNETSSLFAKGIAQVTPGNIYQNIRPFGMINECFSLDICETEQKAMRIKWVYDTYYDYRGNKKLDAEQAMKKMKHLAIDEEKLKEDWQNDKLSNFWSNMYNAYTVRVKDRSFGFSSREMDEEEIQLLAEVEHNRWNVERLLFGYRATTKQENAEICINRERKDHYKETEFAHFDIRPYDKLEDDKNKVNAREYDICLSECLSKIFEIQTRKNQSE